MKRKTDSSERRSIRVKLVYVALFVVLLTLFTGLVLPFSGAIDLIFPPAEPCTLADQIIASNMRKPVGGCPAGSGNDVITLHDSITLNKSLPRITGTITVEGNGHTIDGNGKHQIFDVKGGTLHINNLIMTRGKAYEGGAIELADNAELVLSNSTISDSSATFGGAIHGDYSRITVVDSVLINNKAADSGGAIYDVSTDGTLEIAGSTFVGNSGQEGGGFYKRWSRAIIQESTFTDNKAEAGGGFYSNHADIILRKTRLENNTAREGGSVYRKGGTMELHDSIIYGKNIGPEVYVTAGKW